MLPTFVHTCIRVRDIEASLCFYGALGFEQRGRLQFDGAYNVYLGLPEGGDVLELTVNAGRAKPYELGEGYGHIALTSTISTRRCLGWPLPGSSPSDHHTRREAAPSTESPFSPIPTATGSS